MILCRNGGAYGIVQGISDQGAQIDVRNGNPLFQQNPKIVVQPFLQDQIHFGTEERIDRLIFTEARLLPRLHFPQQAVQIRGSLPRLAPCKQSPEGKQMILHIMTDMPDSGFLLPKALVIVFPQFQKMHSPLHLLIIRKCGNRSQDGEGRQKHRRQNDQSHRPDLDIRGITEAFAHTQGDQRGQSPQRHQRKPEKNLPEPLRQIHPFLRQFPFQIKKDQDIRDAPASVKNHSGAARVWPDTFQVGAEKGAEGHFQTEERKHRTETPISVSLRTEHNRPDKGRGGQEQIFISQPDGHEAADAKRGEQDQFADPVLPRLYITDK